MPCFIYFCGSMRGGRQDVDLYGVLVDKLGRHGQVLTPFVADKAITDLGSEHEGGDVAIHDRDVELLTKSDALVAEVTVPSLGVGYEIGRAVALGKPVLCLYRPQQGKLLSAMIRGMDNGSSLRTVDYHVDQVDGILQQFFASVKVRVTGQESSVAELLFGISSMPLQSKAKISAVIGAAVADAASVPLQWIYKDADMDAIGHWTLSGDDIVGDASPAFYPTSKCPFFTVSTGANSCYSDEMKTCLAALADRDGELDIDHIQKAIQIKFGLPDSPYQIALAKRGDKKYPVPGPWINGGVINSLQNMSSGKIPPGDQFCDDNDGLIVCLPAFLLSYNDDDAENTAKLLTTSPLALNHIKIQTRIINNFIKGIPNPIDEAKEAFNSQFPDIVQEITDVQKALASGKSVLEVVSMFGKACGLPGSFQGSLAFILNPASFAHNFSYAIQSNIIAGGDCCSRANFIGACFGAKFGVEGIPVEWIERVEGIEEIIQNAIKVYA